MYDSLKIDGFRAFDAFAIDGLTRVNLLVGKNNAGKTCLLDAVEMAAWGGVLASLWGSPLRRREIWPVAGERAGAGWDLDLSHLFHGHRVYDGASFHVVARTDGAERTVTCSVGSNRHDAARIAQLTAFTGADIPLELSLSGPANPDGEPRLPIAETGVLFGSTAAALGPPGSGGDATAAPQLSNVPQIVAVMRRGRASVNRTPVFLGTSAAGSLSGSYSGALAEIWDLLVLTEKEDEVISALRIVEPSVQRLAFVGQGAQSAAFVKLAGQESRIPIGSLGEGMNRLLALAIHMGLAARRILLIDEIDTGLHYSTMEAMWRFVIESARRLDVQVFATSHSGDCIRALAWLQSEAPDLANDISVHRIDRTASAAVRYSAADIEIAARHHIEVRG